jgi:hypothetical protein
MNARQTTRSISIAGAIIGGLFAYRVIAGLRQAVDNGGTGIPDPSHILLCWPVLLALVFPSTLPVSLFYGLVGILDAATFSLLFFIIANIVHLVISRDSAATEATHEL